MQDLEEKLNYHFKDRTLLQTALTHSSYANENRSKGVECNERLEFLGDSILGMVVADYLYKEHPDWPEGELTRFRSRLVCESNLDNVARDLDLGSYLLLGKGEEAGGGRTRNSVIADAVEALLAAVYLDGGLKAAGKVIQTCILDRIDEREAGSRDYKTTLQELVQRKSGMTLSYQLRGSAGPDHSKIFYMEVLLNGEAIGKGSGRSKKEAEQMAAKAGIHTLKERGFG